MLKLASDAVFQHRHALWAYVDHKGLVPTNNEAEQAIRKAVLWRKGSFGADSGTTWTRPDRIELTGTRILPFKPPHCPAYARALMGHPAFLFHDWRACSPNVKLESNDHSDRWDLNAFQNFKVKAASA